MSKANNLKDFLTGVADAIREKKGTTALINPQDFSDEIKSIETGGGGAVESKEYKDVNFFDYDGTILYSYSWDEALQLTEMPPLPNHDGLICQGWNWTYEELQQADGFADIGAVYITDDGKTRLLITIPSNDRLEMTLRIGQSVSNGIRVDWGDGTAEELINGTGNVTMLHTFATRGSYCVSLETVAGVLYLGHNGRPFTSPPFSRFVKGVHAGYGLTNIRNGSLKDSTVCFITLHDGVTDFSTSCCNNCTSLSHITIPRSIKSIINQCLKNCYFLKSVSLPYGFTFIGYQTLYGCAKLQGRLNIKNVSKIESNAFYNCIGLTSFKLPDIGNIDSNVFNNCTSVKFYDFTQSTSIPTLTNTNAFTNVPSDCKIVVPDALVDEWKAATNWTTYATYIIGETEYLENGGIL